MATINLGAIKFNWKGAYNNSTAYTVDDVVSSGGSSYVCILASTGNAVSNATYWSVMSQAGTDGTDVGTTITTQGDLLFRDGSGLQRLAKGTASQVLTMNSGATQPEWAAAAGGATAVVASGTISGSPSEIVHDGIFTSAYKFYELFIADLHGSANAQWFLQMRNSNANITGSHYRGISNHPHFSGTTYSQNNHGHWDTSTGWQIVGGASVNSHVVSAMMGKIYFPYADNISTYNAIKWNTWSQESSTTGQYNTQDGGGIYAGYSQYDGFRLYPASGTIAEGEYTVIGYKQ